MLLRITSDIHIEQFGYGLSNQPYPELSPDDRDKEAVLVLAGDICEFGFHEHHAFQHFLDNISNRFKTIVYVPGNHEYWNHNSGAYGSEGVQQRIANLEERGIHVLDDDNIIVDGVVIHGTTLWTNYYNEDPLHMFACMSCYDFVEGKTQSDDGPVTTNIHDIIERNRLARHALLSLSTDIPTIVVSHFAPSRKSISTQYVGYKSNAHYINDLDDFIFDRPNIKMWIHGHVHSQHDYMIGQTRVVANPLGFDYEQHLHTKDLDFVEIKC